MLVMLFSTVLLAFSTAVYALEIYTPASATQCEPTLLSWTETSAPYYVEILPGGQASATPYESYGPLTGLSMSWDTNIAAGVSVTFEIKDSTGLTSYSGQVTIESSDNSSCVLNTLEIYTPAAAVQCEPTLLTWKGTYPPYYISILPGGQVNAAPLETFPAQTGTSLTWDTNIAAGTTITLEIQDSTGYVNYSGLITIQYSDDSLCLSD